MPGRGPAPKDPSKRAGHRAKTDGGLRVIAVNPEHQPDLPTVEVEQDGMLVEFQWPARTIEWWQMWSESPLAAEFTANDWSELMDTALLHARYWRGNMSLAGELRLRVAKFGATPEDRARLRITFAAADEAEGRREIKRSSSARDRRGGLTAAG